MTYTIEELRLKYPRASDEALREAVAILNRAPAKLRDIWRGEDQTSAEHQGVGPDNLTAPMRELNAFADENALRQPFPTP